MGGACATCDKLRAAERLAFVTPHSYGRCEACTERIHAKMPRCWSCECNPAPHNQRLACRGCVRTCIRTVKRLHQEKEADFRREVADHETWIATMDPSEHARWLKFDDRRLEAPHRGNSWDFDHPPPLPADRHQASCFLIRNPRFLWDDGYWDREAWRECPEF